MATVCLVNRRIVYEKLWQTICILERQLLVGIMQNQHSSYSMSWSRNTNESCHLAVWLFHDNAPALKSLVAQQALCDCEFVQLNHSTYSPDLALSDYFLIRNLKYHLRGTWFTDDESRVIAVEWESKRKINFQGINSWEVKMKKCTDVAGEYVEKWQYKWYNMLTFYSQVAKVFDRPLYMRTVTLQHAPVRATLGARHCRSTLTRHI